MSTLHSIKIGLFAFATTGLILAAFAAHPIA